MNKIFRKFNLKAVLLLVVCLMIVPSAFAQFVPPPPPAGVPIDGLSGILVMAAAALFGKKYLDRKK